MSADMRIDLEECACSEALSSVDDFGSSGFGASMPPVPKGTAFSSQASLDIRAELFALQDLGYRDFNAKLVPTVDPERIIGVRTPDVRALAKRLAREHPDQARAFMDELPHRYLEEANLHGELIGLLFARDADPTRTFAALEAFLPHVDNWGTCDLTAPKQLARFPKATLGRVRDVWLRDPGTYVVRFGVNELMRDYLDERFSPEHLRWVAELAPGEYYIDMARAWYFSIALVKQYDATIEMFRTPTLDAWTHNKALQKARESRRIDAATKDYLQTLKVR